MKKSLVALCVLAGLAVAGCATTPLIDFSRDKTIGADVGFTVAIINWRPEPVEIRLDNHKEIKIKAGKTAQLFLPADDRIRTVFILYKDPEDGIKNIALCQSMFSPQVAFLPNGRHIVVSYAINVD